MLERLLSKRTLLPILGAAILCTYLPAFRNGFVADDYVFLDWSRRFIHAPGFLFTLPPLNFRMTSFLLFAGLQQIFGVEPAGFYAVSLLLHFVSCLLLWRLLLRFGSPVTAGIAALFFAVFQAPQEAVMWLAAGSEMLQTIFILATLLLWIREKHSWALLTYSIALISKESAPVVLLLIPLIQWRLGKRLFPAAYFLFLIPTAVFGVVFLLTFSANSMIRAGVYSFGGRPFTVLLKSLHLLFRPWLYIALLLWIVWNRRWPVARDVAFAIGAVVVPMLPYLFLTYATYLPSRQLYLASTAFAFLLASVIEQVDSRTVRLAFIAAFCVFNVGYLWTRIERAFVQRERPTAQLLALLRAHQPTQILIFDFAYDQPDIAKDVSLLAPGWTRDLVGVNGTGETCTDCVILRWDPKTKEYAGKW